MKKLTRILAALTVFTLSLSAFSCGQNAESSVSEETSVLVSEDSSASESSSDDTSEKSESSTTSNSNSKDSGSSASESSSTDSSPNSDKNSSSSSSENSSSGSSKDNSTASSGHSASSSESNQSQNPAGNETASGNNTPAQSNSNSSDQSGSQGSNSQNSSQNSGSSSSENSGNSSAPAPAEPATEAPTEEVKTYTAEITLGAAPQFTGSNVSVSGSKVLISGGGDYMISGSVTDGQVEVNTTEKVKLYLNGVSIANSSGPAIQITDAKRAVIVLMDGTASILRDGNEDKINDGVIFSNDTLEIKGNGTLNIVSGNAHGIASDDDVIIENGTFNINSIKSGIYAHDDITINGGTLNIMGGTNGLKSKGTLNINGGYSIISGGPKDEKSSVYAAGAFTYTGGYLFAAGNTVTAPAQTSNPYIVAGFNTARTAGSSVTLYLNGGEAVTFVPHNNFRCVMMITPEIAVGNSFGITVGDTYYGDYSVSDIQNVFTIEE